MIWKKEYTFVAPRLPAASSIAKSKFARLAVTTRMTYGIPSRVWPIRRLGITGSFSTLTT